MKGGRKTREGVDGNYKEEKNAFLAFFPGLGVNVHLKAGGHWGATEAW